jgi:ribonucleoside-diphosphate reductase alpha chain
MLDNVVDINFYPTTEARNSNLKHRPVGLGIMGFQDALFQLRRPMESRGAREFADEVMELISYHAILGSSTLAAERGAYESFPGSKWDRGIFPIDTLDHLERERGMEVTVPRTQRLDWNPVREHVARHGMRNSNTMAVAPTATISNIAGCFPCIEPIYKNIYVKANMSGEFTVVNTYLVRDLKERGLWTQEMLEQLKYYDGNVSAIPDVPEDLKPLYKEAFEIEPVRLIQLTALRGKWIDQSQSHNVFMKGASGPKLEEIYMTAWETGLKTTYYLRTLGASQIEKSTLDARKYGYTQKRDQGVAGAVASGAGSSGGAGAGNGNGNGASAEQGADQGGKVDGDGAQAASPGSGDDGGGTGAAERGHAGAETGAGENGGDYIVEVKTLARPATEVTSFCALDDPECEACQ